MSKLEIGFVADGFFNDLESNGFSFFLNFQIMILFLTTSSGHSKSTCSIRQR